MPRYVCLFDWIEQGIMNVRHPGPFAAFLNTIRTYECRAFGSDPTGHRNNVIARPSLKWAQHAPVRGVEQRG